MEKNKLEKFIKKYYLKGTCESVLFVVENDKLRTKGAAADNNAFCDIQVDDNLGFENGSYAVYNTQKLSSLLDVVGDSLDISVVTEKNEPVALTFSDGDTDVTYALADEQVIPKVPDLKKLPPFDISIVVDEQFINTYVKAKGALEVETFAVSSNGKKAEAVVTLGHGNKNTNKVKMKATTEKAGQLDDIEFSATYLREILLANKDAENGKFEVSSKGLARLTFEVDGIKSTYYLIEKATEE